VLFSRLAVANIAEDGIAACRLPKRPIVSQDVLATNVYVCGLTREKVGVGGKKLEHWYMGSTNR